MAEELGVEIVKKFTGCQFGGLSRLREIRARPNTLDANNA